MYLSNANKYKIYYLYFANPSTNKITCRSCRTKLKSEASKFLKEFKQVEEVKPDQKLLDVKEFIFDFIKRNNSVNTYRSYLLSFRHLIRIIGNKKLTEINKTDIEKFKSERIREVKPVSVNIDIRNIKAIVNKLVSLDLLEFSKISGIKEFKIEKKKHLNIGNTDLINIINHLPEQLKQIVKFSLLTANRISETLNLKIKDIDFVNNIISIFQQKSNKFKYIPISNNLRSLLPVNRCPDEYLFHKERCPFIKLQSNFVSKKFKQTTRALGLNPDYKFHCLRHTAITELINKNVPVPVVKEIAGHQSITTTMMYTHIGYVDMLEGIDKIKIGIIPSAECSADHL